MRKTTLAATLAALLGLVVMIGGAANALVVPTWEHTAKSTVSCAYQGTDRYNGFVFDGEYTNGESEVYTIKMVTPYGETKAVDVQPGKTAYFEVPYKTDDATLPAGSISFQETAPNANEAPDTQKYDAQSCPREPTGSIVRTCTKVKFIMDNTKGTESTTYHRSIGKKYHKSSVVQPGKVKVITKHHYKKSSTAVLTWNDQKVEMPAPSDCKPPHTGMIRRTNPF